MKKIIFLFYIIQVSFPLFSQADPITETFENLNLEELMNIKVSVASSREKTLKTSPAIITVLNADDIAKTGASDLVDILNLIPGFQFGADVENVISWGFRGIWGIEGKMILIIDDFEMNERLYGGAILNARYPVSLIEKIEVIRGPGSVQYGGHAELAVIKVTTKASQVSKVQNLKSAARIATSTNEQKQKSNLEQSIEIGGSIPLNPESSFGFAALTGETNLSDSNMIDSVGNSESLIKNSRQSPRFFLGQYQNGTLQMRILSDAYSHQDITAYGAHLNHPIRVEFNKLGFMLNYQHQLDSQWTLRPSITITRDQPYKSLDTDPRTLAGDLIPQLYYHRTVTNTKAKLLADKSLTENLNLTLGLEHNEDRGMTYIENNFFAKTGNNKTNISSDAIFSELESLFYDWQMTLGGRFESNSAAGSSFVPRFALVTSWQKYYLKFLASQSYRSPDIQNYDNGDEGMKSEKTTVFETEVGGSTMDWMSWNINLFHLQINEPIIYYYDSTDNTDHYKNFDKLNTSGLETQVRFKTPWGLNEIGYSYYSAEETNIESYQVPQNNTQFLGLPKHKLTWLYQIRVTHDWSLTPQIIYKSRYFATDYNPDLGLQEISEMKPTTLASLLIEKKNLMNDDLTLMFGAKNILNQKYYYPQPYNGGRNPVPGKSTEYFIKLVYESNF